MSYLRQSAERYKALADGAVGNDNSAYAKTQVGIGRAESILGRAFATPRQDGLTVA